MPFIPLDEIAPGATIRFAMIDGVQYLSTRDLIMHLCEKDNKRASETWIRMSQERKEELSVFCRSFTFDGRGQQEQPVITIPGALRLMSFLNGENARKNRPIITDILSRNCYYCAGDVLPTDEIDNSAIDEIEAIPLNEIAPGATIRFAVVDGVQYLSIRDFIMHMCDKDNNHAAEIWRRLPEDKKNELNAFCVNYKFPGRGQQEQPVITFPGAIKLAMFLPGEKAKKNRSVMAKILVRYYAGDPSLIPEIEANAASDAPVAQMARASLADEERDPDNTISLGNKRALENLEIEERVVNLRHKNALAERAENENKILHIRGQLNVFNEVTDRYMFLCSPNAVLDERARLIFKDSLLNFVVRFNPGAQPAIAGADGPPAVPVAQSIGFLTISTVAQGLGYQFDPAQLKRIGARIAQAYYLKHKESPPKHDQFVDGAVRKVNTYQESDRELIEDAIKHFAYMAGIAARA